LSGTAQEQDAGGHRDPLGNAERAVDQQERDQRNGTDEQERLAQARRRDDREALASRMLHLGQPLVVKLSPAATEEARQPERNHLVGVLAVCEHLGQVHPPPIDGRHVEVELEQRVCAAQEQHADRGRPEREQRHQGRQQAEQPQRHARDAGQRTEQSDQAARGLHRASVTRHERPLQPVVELGRFEGLQAGRGRDVQNALERTSIDVLGQHAIQVVLDRTVQVREQQDHAQCAKPHDHGAPRRPAPCFRVRVPRPARLMQPPGLARGYGMLERS
jgi:hypothetical protein